MLPSVQIPNFYNVPSLVARVLQFDPEVIRFVGNVTIELYSFLRLHIS